jgi:L-alanine-DL-glutamate epimerase-like enolase superfamily enzyme
LDVDHILFAIELSFDQEEFAAFDDGLIVFEEILAHNDAEDYRRIRRSSFQREAATNENRCSRYSSRGCLGTIWRSIWPDHSHLGHFAIPEVVS